MEYIAGINRTGQTPGFDSRTFDGPHAHARALAYLLGRVDAMFADASDASRERGLIMLAETIGGTGDGDVFAYDADACEGLPAGTVIYLERM